MNVLSVLKQLVNIEEKDNCALRGVLSCSCGNQFFKLNYQGKRTRGILSPDLVRKQGKLIVEVVCSSCGDKIRIYDSNEHNKLKTKTSIEMPFEIYNEEPQKFRLSYNYQPTNYKTNDYEMIFIEIGNNQTDKWHTIVEE